MKRWAVVLGVLVVFGLVAYAERAALPPALTAWLPGGQDSAASGKADGGAGAKNARADNRPIAVKAVAARAGALPVLRRTIGTVVPVRETQLGSPAAGIVASIAVTDGAVVKAGDLIVQLDERAIDAAIEKDKALTAKDQATLDDANAALARIESLVNTGVNTKQAGDDARAAVREAAAAVDADRAQLAADQVSLAYTRIVAPFDGRIGAVSVSPGAYVSPGAPVVLLTQMQPVYAEFTLSESDLALARGAMAGGRLTAAVAAQDAAGKTESGAVTFIDNTVDAASGTFKLRADLANASGALWPGQSLGVTVQAGEVPGLVLVPDAAVEPRDNGFVSYVVTADQVIDARPVTVALRANGETGLSAGVQAGELVVTEGQALLRKGSRVTVETAAAPAGSGGAGGGAAEEASAR